MFVTILSHIIVILAYHRETELLVTHDIGDKFPPYFSVFLNVSADANFVTKGFLAILARASVACRTASHGGGSVAVAGSPGNAAEDEGGDGAALSFDLNTSCINPILQEIATVFASLVAAVLGMHSVCLPCRPNAMEACWRSGKSGHSIATSLRR